MKMLDRFVALGAVGAMAIAFAPLTFAQENDTSLFARARFGFAPPLVQCDDLDEDSDRYEMCAQREEARQRIEDECGEPNRSDEHRTCVRTILEELDLSAMGPMRSRIRSAVKEECGDYEVGSDEFKTCAREFRNDHQDDENRPPRGRHMRLPAEIREEIEAECGELEPGTDEHKTCVRTILEENRPEIDEDQQERGSRGFGRRGPRHGFGPMNAEIKAQIDACHELEDDERRDCMVELRSSIRAEAAASAQ